MAKRKSNLLTNILPTLNWSYLHDQVCRHATHICIGRSLPKCCLDLPVMLHPVQIHGKLG